MFTFFKTFTLSFRILENRNQTDSILFSSMSPSPMRIVPLFKANKVNILINTSSVISACLNSANLFHTLIELPKQINCEATVARHFLCIRDLISFLISLYHICSCFFRLPDCRDFMLRKFQVSLRLICNLGKVMIGVLLKITNSLGERST